MIYMFAILVLGIFIGAMVVMFALENTALITVSFFSDQVTAPLALIIIAAFVAGIGVTLIAMLPRFIRDALDAYAARREIRKTELTIQNNTTPEEQKVIA